MAIQNLSKDDFVAILTREIYSSRPIDSFEHLRGRDKEMDSIEQALLAPGRHVFIFGDRGVGKTSLAQTAAFKYQSSDNAPIIVGCEQKSTFTALLNHICQRLGSSRLSNSVAWDLRGKANLGLVSLEVRKKFEQGSIPAVEDINSAVEVARIVSTLHSARPIVVVDEFDRIASGEERQLFADFVKQLADQNVAIKFIFCGVASTLDDLLTAHESIYRYFETIQLPRMYFGPRQEIIDGAASALGIKASDSTRFRVAAISDGFPHYVHLVSEKLFWEMFNDPDVVFQSTDRHFQQAVDNAVISVEQHLRSAYDKATMKDRDDYQQILWAVADHSDLTRNINAIEESYRRIMITLHKDCLPHERFVTRLNQLKLPAHGKVLKSDRRSWYSFRESILRGYVRLKAEQSGLQLATDVAAQLDRRSTLRTANLIAAMPMAPAQSDTESSDP